MRRISRFINMASETLYASRKTLFGMEILTYIKKLTAEEHLKSVWHGSRNPSERPGAILSSRQPCGEHRKNKKQPPWRRDLKLGTCGTHSIPDPLLCSLLVGLFCQKTNACRRSTLAVTGPSTFSSWLLSFFNSVHYPRSRNACETYDTRGD